MFNEWMCKVFGASWRTTVYGWIAVAALFVSTNPELFHNVWITKVAAFISGGAFLKAFHSAADKQAVPERCDPAK